MDINSKLKDVVTKLSNGEITSDYINLINPDFYKANRNILLDVEKYKIMNHPVRKTMTTCDWFVGTTWCGKTRLAEFMAENNYKSYYVANLKDIKRGWWKDYKQQECIIINNFGGEIPYSGLLSLADWDPFAKVCLKGIGGVPFNSKHIFITSPLKPEEIYKKKQKEDKLVHLLRRINIWKLESQFVPTEDNDIDDKFIQDTLVRTIRYGTNIPYSERYKNDNNIDEDGTNIPYLERYKNDNDIDKHIITRTLINKAEPFVEDIMIITDHDLTDIPYLERYKDKK